MTCENLDEARLGAVSIGSAGVSGQQPSSNPKFPKGFFSPERVAQGKVPSETVCASCHLWPLENHGDLHFDASTFAESTAGRWLTMDAGDVDGDGDLDIVLGAARRGPGRDAYIPPELSRKWGESGVTLMLLENLKADRRQ